jgi:hypothetical protein
MYQAFISFYAHRPLDYTGEELKRHLGACKRSMNRGRCIEAKHRFECIFFVQRHEHEPTHHYPFRVGSHVGSPWVHDPGSEAARLRRYNTLVLLYLDISGACSSCSAVGTRSYPRIWRMRKLARPCKACCTMAIAGHASQAER